MSHRDPPSLDEFTPLSHDIAAGDVAAVLLRARFRPRIDFERAVRWRGEHGSERAWTRAARALAADLIAAAYPPFLADEPPADLPIGWAPEAAR